MQNPRGRTRSANLQRQRESRDASSDDAHVVIRCRVIGVRKARPDALRESLSCLLTHLRHLRSHVHASPLRSSPVTLYPEVRPLHQTGCEEKAADHSHARLSGTDLRQRAPRANRTRGAGGRVQVITDYWRPASGHHAGRRQERPSSQAPLLICNAGTFDSLTGTY